MQARNYHSILGGYNRERILVLRMLAISGARDGMPDRCAGVIGSARPSGRTWKVFWYEMKTTKSAEDEPQTENLATHNVTVATP